MCHISEMLEEVIILQAKAILSRRFRRGQSLTSTSDVVDYFILQLADKEQEIFGVVFLDNQLRLIEYQEMFYGTHNQVTVYAREIVKRALQYNAASVILVHNHPSGAMKISQEDRNVTSALKAALALVDIILTDHLVVCGTHAFSFAEKGLI